jgi:hypothetical protein
MPKGQRGGATIKVGTIIDSMTSELAEVPRETIPDGKGGVKIKRPVGRPPVKKLSRADWLREQKDRRGRTRTMEFAVEQLKERMLCNDNLGAVLTTIIRAATDDSHSNQAVAWKLLADRMLPLSYFEKDKATGQRATVNITISGLDGTSSEIAANSAEIIEGETIEG